MVTDRTLLAAVMELLHKTEELTKMVSDRGKPKMVISTKKNKSVQNVVQMDGKKNK